MDEQDELDNIKGFSMLHEDITEKILAACYQEAGCRVRPLLNRCCQGDGLELILSDFYPVYPCP